MNDVRFKINADGSGAKTVLSGISNQVKGLGTSAMSMGSALKGAFAATFGIAGIGMLVKQMADFADEVQNASERLNITVEQVQSLRTAARHAGKDLGFFDGVFTKLDTNLSKALKKGSKENALATALGLSGDDIKSGQKFDVLKKMLESTKGMDDETAKGKMGGLVGLKNAGALLAMRDEILSPNGKNLVGADTLGRIDELMDAFEDLKDVIVVGLIPTFEKLIEYLTSIFGTWATSQKTMDEIDAEAAALYYQTTGGKEADPLKWAANQAQYQTTAAAMSVDPFHTDEEKKLALKKLQSDYVKNVYGEAVDGLMRTPGMRNGEVVSPAFSASPESDVLGSLKATKERRTKERELRNSLRGMSSDREAPFEKAGKEKAGKSMLDASLGSNQFMKIGGMLGVDAQYRLERLSIQANEYMARMADTLDSIDSKMSDEPSDEFN